jgi:hypothetical protein
LKATGFLGAFLGLAVILTVCSSDPSDSFFTYLDTT